MPGVAEAAPVTQGYAMLAGKRAPALGEKLPASEQDPHAIAMTIAVLVFALLAGLVL